MSATCEWCSQYIEVSNFKFPGFCSPDCRDLDRQQRDFASSVKAQRRADARQHRRATEARRHYLN